MQNFIENSVKKQTIESEGVAPLKDSCLQIHECTIVRALERTIVERSLKN